MSPERIYQALTTGLDAGAGEGPQRHRESKAGGVHEQPPDGQRAGGRCGSDAERCKANPPLTDPGKTPQWNGWGNDLGNTRFQPAAAARLTAAQVPATEVEVGVRLSRRRLGERSARDRVRPRVRRQRQRLLLFTRCEDRLRLLVVRERLDHPQRASRRAYRRPGSAARYAVFFGDGHANVYALDAQTGKQLWKTRVDSHFVARITAGREVLQRQAVRSGVVLRGVQQRQPGLLLLHRARERRRPRRQHRQADLEGVGHRRRAAPYKTMANGVVLYRPAGGAVWNSPTVDPVRNAIYFGTGDATTAPSPRTTDGIMAVDIDTGKLLWSYQATANDVFMGGCTGTERSDACPTPMGPDMDIGNSPMLVTLPDGKRVLIGGTKSADVFALDPDDNGALLYRVNAAGGPINVTGRAARGSIVWGGATDGQQVYYGTGGAGLVALKPAAGEVAWSLRLRGGGAAQGLARHLRSFRVSSSRAPATEDSSPCRQPTGSCCGSSTPRRSSRRSTTSWRAEGQSPLPAR